MIPYSCQDIDESDIEAVVRVLRSDYLTQGSATEVFEDDIKKRVGTSFAVAVSSATAALHLGCKAFGISTGDRVWTSPITFVSTANSVLYCGAKVDFVDVDKRTGNLCASALAEKCQRAEKNGTLPKLVIPVHLAGNSCDMRTIHELSQKYGFKILEDASHALGASSAGRQIGSCQFSDAAVFSFHAVKMITTGEGGMLVTNDAKMANQAAMLRTHGITRDLQKFQNSKAEMWYYEMQDLGFHYRMTDFQAALGSSQLRRLDTFLVRRRKLAARYGEKLHKLPLKTIYISETNNPSWHLYPILLDSPEQRLHLFTKMRKEEIGVNVHYIPVTRQPFYQDLGFNPRKYPGAEWFYEREISIPLQTRMSEEEQDRIIDHMKDVLCG